jgi:hypothetical protein
MLVLALYALTPSAHAACAVTLARPAANAVVGSPPSFRWTAAGDCRSFVVQLARNPGFASGLTSLPPVGTAGRASTMQQSTYDALTSVGTTSYYWRVLSVDRTSVTATSAARRVTLQTPDADGDGYKSVLNGGSDCDDANGAIHPSAAELCNGVDDDCDGSADLDPAGPVYYDDEDGDGYGGDATASLCSGIDLGGDCDDADDSVHPAASEVCDGVDDDCNGLVDVAAVDATLWREDADGDGQGNPATGVSACDAPEGYVDDATDCDDNDPASSTCADNECASGSSVCDVHALCWDSEDSYECECADGYGGDGYSCSPVALSLEGLRWDLPCAAGVNSTVCTTSAGAEDEVTLGGDPATLYALTLRIRGVIETKGYDGGTTDGFFNIGGTPSPDAWNIYSLRIESPDQTYYLNAGESDLLYCWEVDYTQTVEAYGGSTISLHASSEEGTEIVNTDAFGNPIRVEGVYPDPAAYDGQFLQVDVGSVTVLP